jgi:protease I
MLVFIGGPGTVQYWDDPLAQRLVREAAESQKVLGAICIAPVILARAGMLKGRRATAWPSPEDEEELKKAGAEFSAQPVERDGNIVTANGPDAARQFARQLLRALGE